MIVRRDEAIENVITTLLSYSSRALTNFMKPFILLLIRSFAVESQMTKNYGLQVQEMNYYLLFAGIMIIPQNLMEVFFLNLLELIHEYKLYDYLDYCRFRFENRPVKWMAYSFSLDPAIDQMHRALDNLCFSNQYYFMVTVLASGIYLLTFGVSIIIHLSYNPLADPAFFVIVFALLFYCSVGKFILTKIPDKFPFLDVWSMKGKEDKNMIEKFTEYLEKSELNMEDMITSDLIRQHFLQMNKDWLIRHMHYYIDKTQFSENDGYLLKLYRTLVEEETFEKKQKRRQELLIKRKEYKEQEEVNAHCLMLV
jgi:hypothetical protein